MNIDLHLQVIRLALAEVNFIDLLEAHADGITILEVQRGECSEDDIIRLEDDYDRVTDGL